MAMVWCIATRIGSHLLVTRAAALCALPLFMIGTAAAQYDPTSTPLQSTAPSNDDFANAIEITETPATVTGTNVDATREAGEPLHADIPGGVSVWYRWRAPSDGAITFRTCEGTDFVTLLAVYTGDTLESLTPVAGNIYGCGLQSTVTFNATAGQLYSIAVDGWAGDQGTFTLTSQLPPDNDRFAQTIALNGASGSVSGSNVGATREPGEPMHAAVPGGASVWYQWIAPRNGTATFHTCEGTGFDTVLAIYTGESLTTLQEIASNDDSCDLQSSVTFAATAGTAYFIAVDGYSGQQGNFILTWVLPPANDDFANAIQLTGSSGSVAGTNLGAGREPGEPSHAGETGGASVWYRWRAPIDGNATFHTCEGTNFDTILAVYTGQSFTSLQEVAANNDNCGLQSSVSFTATEGVIYHIAVDGFSDDEGNFTLRYALRTFEVQNRALQQMGIGGGPFDMVAREDGAYFVTAGSRGAFLWNMETGRVIRKFSGHTEFTRSVALSPDKSRLLTASDDGTARLWDVDSGALIRVIRDQEGDNREVNAVAFSPDGRRIVTSREDDEGAYLWDAETGDLVRGLGGHTGTVTSVAFSPDGTQVLTGSMDSTAILWDVESGEPMQTFIGHNGPITAVAFFPLGFAVATGSTDRTARLWDIDGGNTLLVFAGHDDWVNTVEFTPDGTRLLTGSDDATARIWNAETGNQMRLLVGHQSWINSVAFLDGGMTCLTASADQTIRLWDWDTAMELRSFVGHWGEDDTATTSSIPPSPTPTPTPTPSPTPSIPSTELSSAPVSPTPAINSSEKPRSSNMRGKTSARSLRALREAKFAARKVGTRQLEVDTIASVAFSPNGSQILTSGQATLWELKTGDEILTFVGHGDLVTSIAISPDGTRSLTGSRDQTAKLWDTGTGDEIFNLPGHTDIVTGVAISPNGTRALTSSSDNTAKLWNAVTGAEIRTFTGHTGRVSSVAFSPDGSLALTGSWDDNTARLWNVETGDEIRAFVGHTAGVTSVAFSPDGTRIVTGSQDTTARIWDTQSGTGIHVLNDHTDSVTGVAYSPDGSTIVTGSWDWTAMLWDPETGLRSRTLTGHTAPVDSVAVSPDSNLVVTGSLDGTALVWELKPPRAIVVAGSGPFPGNPVAQQTQDLAAYSYRILQERGYTADDILLLSAFGPDLDATGDGISDVDAELSVTGLRDAITGDFGSDASRLFILLLGHGYRTDSFVAFRATPNELISTNELAGWLDTLQNDSPVEVTLLADFCFSGQFTIDAGLDDSQGIPANRRTIISSTSPTAEAIFLPPPDTTSFTHIFLFSAFMGNSFGESFRAGEDFFSSFPVANQTPMIDAASLASGEADRRFFGASWLYGVQGQGNINDFFPVFDEVSPEETIAPDTPVDLYARLLPNQPAESAVAVIRPRTPAVLAGEPIVALPQMELIQNPGDTQLWETTAPGDLFQETGPHTIAFSARLPAERVSSPQYTRVIVSDGIDPDATPINAIIAVAEAADVELRDTILHIGSWAYSVALQRHRNEDGQPIPGAVEWVSVNAPQFGGKNTEPRPREIRALEAYDKQLGRQGSNNDDLIAAINGLDNNTGRLYIHIVSDDARNGVLRLSDSRAVSANDLDAALDTFQSRPTEPEVVVVIDAPGSGSFYDPLLPTGGQKRLVVTNGRATDGAVFLPAPLLTSFTQRFMTRAWQGGNLLESFQGARNFFEDFLAHYPEQERVSPRINDATMAQNQWLGRRWAFGAETELPFILEVAPEITADAGTAIPLWVEFIEGVEPVEVFAQTVPPGLDIGSVPLSDLPRIPLAREGDTWRWSGSVALGTPGTHRIAYWAEYQDGSATRLTAPAFSAVSLELSSTGWMSY